MRVSFEWVNEDKDFPDNHCKVSLACDDFQISKEEVIGRLMANVIRTMKLDNDPHGDTIFFRTVTEEEAKLLNDLLDDLRADEWNNEI